MRGRLGGQKNQWFSRSRSAAGENGRRRSIAQARDEAETRSLEAESSYVEASTRKVELENQKLAGEIAHQRLQAQQLRAQIAKEEAEMREAEFGLLRAQTLLIVFLLMVVLVLFLALVNPALLEAIGKAMPSVPR